MSSSVPPESSALETTFLVGADLVQFDRRDLPIYQVAEGRSLEAVIDETPYGAPLDRVFGEPGDVHLDGAVPALAVSDDASASLVGLPAEDPLIALGPLNDAPVDVHDGGHADAAPLAGPVGLFDIGAGDTAPATAQHDGGWHTTGFDGIFDFQA